MYCITLRRKIVDKKRGPLWFSYFCVVCGARLPRIKRKTSSNDNSVDFDVDDERRWRRCVCFIVYKRVFFFFLLGRAIAIYQCNKREGLSGTNDGYGEAHEYDAMEIHTNGEANKKIRAAEKVWFPTVFYVSETLIVKKKCTLRIGFYTIRCLFFFLVRQRRLATLCDTQNGG